MNKQELLNMYREMYFEWVKAEKAVQTGQEYRMGTRQLRRADLREIRASIKYWKGEIDSLEGNSRIRTQQIIPRDM